MQTEGRLKNLTVQAEEEEDKNEKDDIKMRLKDIKKTLIEAKEWQQHQHLQPLNIQLPLSDSKRFTTK